MKVLTRTYAEGDDTMKMRTIKTNRLKNFLRGAAGFGVLVALSFLVPAPSAAVDLIHNSKDTGSTKWNSNWGVPGGRYGAFTCATCHEPNAKPNIKNVRATISVMNPTSSHLLPNGLKSVSVNYRNVTSQGNDRDSHAQSSRICEVCHSQTQYHRYNSSALADKTHPKPIAGGTVCTTCHKHNTGFKGACGGCHGNPPRYASFGNDSGMIGKPRNSNTLTAGQAGHHVTHTETRNMVCDTCHYISGTTAKMPNLSNTIDIGFFGFGGKVTSGTYIPYSGANRGYRIASGTPNTTIATVSTNYATANICANVYCHGGGLITGGTVQRPPLTGGTNLVTPPRWDAPAQNQCGSCHGATASAPPTTAGHLKHAGSATGYGFNCDFCHPGIDMGHVQGVVRWSFNQNVDRTRGAKYQANGALQAYSSGNTGVLAPSAAFGQCADVMCHGDGRGGAGYVLNPTWGGSLPADCVGCHGNIATTSNPITSKGHKAHIYNTSARFNNFDFKCYECHVATVDSTGKTVISRSLHVNGTRDVSWGPTAAYVPTGGSAALPYNVNQTCSVYCHSNGQGTFKAPPTPWKDIGDGAQGNIKCDYCHGGLASDGTSAISSMRHPNHIGSGPLPHRPVNCNWCHSNTVAPDGQSVYNGTGVKHINRSIDVTFFKMANYSGTYLQSNKRCSNTYCHASGGSSSRDWDTTALNTCGNCHEANNTSTASATLSAAHRKHYNTTVRPTSTTAEGWASANKSVNANVFTCGVCHWSDLGPTTSHVNGPPVGVTNGSVAEVALHLPFTPPAGTERLETITRGTGVTPDGRGYGYSTGTTCNTYCHSDGQGGDPKIAGGKFVWTTTQASCGNCHNKYGDTGSSVTWSGKHSKHLAGGRSTNVTCNACHSGTAADNTSLIVGKRDMHPNGFRNVTGNATVTKGLRWNSVTKECSNAYCHFNRIVIWGVNESLPTGCTGCHGGVASSGSAINSSGHKAHVNNDSARFGGFFFACADCHANTTSTNDAISNPAFHANGTKDVAWGPRAGGTGTLAFSPAASCTVYCHSNGKGTFRGQPKLWRDMTSADEGTINCDYCHNGLATDSTAISSARHTNHIGSGPLPHRAIQCNWCHSSTVGTNGVSVFNGTGVKHINRTVDVTFIKMANFSGSYDLSNTHVCTNTYCHGNNATTSVRDWDTTTINTCGNCHEASNITTGGVGLSNAHRKHYNTTVRPSSTSAAGWDSTILSVNTNVFNCGVCHPPNPTTSHIDGPPTGVTNGSVAQVALRLPFTIPVGVPSRPESIVRGTGVQYDGRGYGYSSGTTCDTYCHSDGNGNPGKRNAGSPTPLQWTTASAIACGDCHNKSSDSPTAITTTWSKPHNKHANTYGNGGVVGSYNNSTNNTVVTCAACHASTAASNTSLVANSRAKHPNGFRNISASATVGSAAFDWDKGNNQCKNGYCHSRAYSFTDYSTPWIKWSDTQVVSCGSCHTAYPTGPDYANGYKGKANSHPKHAAFWGFTCNYCHNATSSTGTSITSFRNHVNKSYNPAASTTMTFAGRANTFTATAANNPPVNQTTCRNVNCHGGNATKVFTWGATNKCGDCHLTTAADAVYYGFSKTPGTIANINSTEWRYSGHGKESGSYDKTGAPFAGFSSAAANGTANPSGDQCLYCHDYGVVHGNSANPLRLRNFNHPTWGKNGVCLACHATSATGVTPGAGYATKSATRKVNKYHFGASHSNNLNSGRFCWDCHDGHGDRANATTGPIAMVHLKPSMTVYTTTGVPASFVANNVVFLKYSAQYFGSTASPYTGICNVCHTYKSTGGDKMTHYTATSSDSHRTGQLCTNCHKHSADTTYDGTAYKGSASSCDGCHGASNSSVGRLSVNGTAGHVIHYNQATVFNHYTGSNKHTGSAYGFACKNCHNTTTSTNHENGGLATMLGTIGYTAGGVQYTDGSGYAYTYATCANNNTGCHQDGRNGVAKTASVAWNTAKSANNCGVCHFNMATNASATGSHVQHAQTAGLACNVCHGAGYSSNGVVYSTHVDKQLNISFNGTGVGTTYSKSAPITLGGTFGNCANGNCHGTAAKTWGTNTTAHTCTKCHGTLTTATSVSNAQMAPNTGAHQAHVSGAGTQNLSKTLTCWECHQSGATATFTNHMNGTKDVTFANASTARDNATTTNWGGSATPTCTVYCHGAKMPYGDNMGTGRTPVWTNSNYLSATAGTAPTAADCGMCHGNPPTTGASSKIANHLGKAPTVSCKECHSHVNTNGTFSDKTLHINGIVNANGHGFPYGGSVHMAAAGSTPWTNCSNCHNTTGSTGTSIVYPVATGVAPGCRSCHVSGLRTPVGTSSCWDCHGASATSGWPNGTAFPNTDGSHTIHSSISLACANCHNGFGAGLTTHGSSNRVASTTANIGLNGIGTGASWNGTACSSTNCHGSGASPAWGANTTAHRCTKCHGTLTTATSVTNAQMAPNSGAHQAHVSGAGTQNLSKTLTCWECHSYNSTTASFTNHMNGAKDVTFANASTARDNATTTNWGGSATPTCTVYCHGAKMPYGDTMGTGRTPAWTNSSYLSATAGTAPTAADCGLCHGNPPSTGTSSRTADHLGKAPTVSCNECHSHVNTNGTFNNKALHINGLIEASGSCVDCHAKVQTGTHGTPRDPVTGEFGLAWGHKKSGRAAVTDADCIVCHLEGDFATQKATTNGKHKDGNIDLRDPDGAGEVAITDLNNANWTFTKFAISFAAGSRTTSAANNVPNIITRKFCLKCHDSNGATNSTARSNNGGTGTAFMPFGGLNLGSGYTLLNGAAAVGGVANVSASFATTNSSGHPVLGPRSKSYPTPARLVAPYNGFTRTAGTKSNSVVMNCFDCHNETLTIASRVTNRTITAHGGALTIPGTLYNAAVGGALVTSPTFCINCHAGYNTTTGHGTGSAISTTSSTGNMSSSRFAPCANCHFSSGSKPPRPLQATDVHGFNGMASTGNAWAWGNATNMRPVALLRNVSRWPSPLSPRPASAPGITAGQANCGGNGMNSTTGGVSCSNDMTNYSPGGAY